MLECYNMMILTEGNDLKWRTLRDRVKKPIFHLGGLETDELAEGMKERAPMEEEDPREAPHEPLRSSVAGVEERTPKITGQLRLGERETSWKKKATVRGLNTPGSAPD
jgi:hypothetical protein